MIERAATCLHWRYIKARHEDGTANPNGPSISRPLLREIRRNGLKGVPNGIQKIRDVLGMDESLNPFKEEIFWGGLGLGAVQFLLVIAGFKGRNAGNWEWYRKALGG